MDPKEPKASSSSSDQLRAVNPEDFSGPSEGAAYDRIHDQLEKFIAAWEAIRSVMKTLIDEIEISRDDDRKARKAETLTRTRISLIAIVFICIHMALTSVVIHTSVELSKSVQSMRDAMDEATDRIREAQSAQIRSQIILSLPEVGRGASTHEQIEEVIQTAVEVAPDDESKESAKELQKKLKAAHKSAVEEELETIEIVADPLPSSDDVSP